MSRTFAARVRAGGFREGEHAEIKTGRKPAMAVIRTWAPGNGPALVGPDASRYLRLSETLVLGLLITLEDYTRYTNGMTPPDSVAVSRVFRVTGPGVVRARIESDGYACDVETCVGRSDLWRVTRIYAREDT